MLRRDGKKLGVLPHPFFNMSILFYKYINFIVNIIFRFIKL